MNRLHRPQLESSGGADRSHARRGLRLLVLPSIATSYFILRNGIAAIALAFPVILLVGVGLDDVQASLSAYYHFSPASPRAYGAGEMRDVFVGALCTIGAFLLFYRGCTVREDLALNVAGVAAILVAIFPMDWPADGGPMTATARVHFASAAIFFAMIGYVCVFRAGDTLPVHDAARRRRFALVYRGFGILMIAVPCVIYVLHRLGPRPANNHLELVVELAGVVVFAGFWLTKGYEILLFERERRPFVARCGCGRHEPHRPIPLASMTESSAR